MTDKNLSCAELIKALKNRTVIRRVALGVSGAVFLALAIFFTVLYPGSRTVEIVEGFIGEYEFVMYNQNWLWGVVPCWFIFAMSGIILLLDFIYCGVLIGQSGGDTFVIYVGTMHRRLYLSGEKLDEVGAITFRTYLEGTKGALRVTASNDWLKSFRITFSDGRSPIDL